MNGFARGGPELKIAKLSKDTLQDRVYRQLSDMILDGGIAPGQLVKLQAIADAFGVSPMPVREALRRLTAENALTVVYGRSIGIPPLSRAKLADLKDVRIEVETIAAGWAAQRVTPAALSNLATHLDELRSANARGDVKAFLRANHNFHFTIYDAAGSRTLLSIIENLWLQVSPYFNLLHDSGNYNSANEQHLAMYEALKSRSAQSLKTAVREDIEAAYRVLETLLD
ncbi:MAG: GntR family transcriptional regulator [Alphaproteobacteria bacterium]|nr:GntR family transcriptional regulator [Alphaproteobacteria bacterium]